MIFFLFSEQCFENVNDFKYLIIMFFAELYYNLFKKIQSEKLKVF